MRYLTIINQGPADASAMHPHDTEAESEYFSELASGSISPTPKSVFAMAVGTDPQDGHGKGARHVRDRRDGSRDFGKAAREDMWECVGEPFWAGLNGG